MQVALISDAIVFSLRETERKVIVDVLKMKGTNNIMTPTDAKESIDHLKRAPKGLLIVDWDQNQEDACKVLAANLKKQGDRTRPVLLIASTVDHSLIATAAEYSVSQIFTEPLTSQTLASRITGLIFTEAGADEIKAALQEVAPLIQEKEWAKAQKIVSKVLTKHPQNLRLKAEAAQIALELGDLSKAEDLLKTMGKEKPPYLRGLSLLGKCYLKQGKNSEAQQVLALANLFNPHNSDRLVLLGQALLEQGHVSSARQSFDQAASLDDNSRDAKFGLAKCDLLDGEVNDALSILKDVANTAETAGIFNMCAVMNARNGKHAAGLDLYKEALKAVRGNSKIEARLHFNRGLAYRRWNKPDLAKDAFREALVLDPEYDKATSQLAILEGKSKVAEDESIYDHSDALGDGSSNFFEDSLEESLFSPGGKLNI